MNNISKWFSWTEALFLSSWKRLANEEDGLNDEIKSNLTKLFEKMDKIREHFGKPITIHVAYRPKEYNVLVKGAKNSAHIYGMACDFHVKDMKCDDVRQNILDNKLLDTLELRMENLPGSSWIHLDLRSVPNGGNRFFNP